MKVKHGFRPVVGNVIASTGSVLNVAKQSSLRNLKDTSLEAKIQSQ